MSNLAAYLAGDKMGTTLLQMVAQYFATVGAMAVGRARVGLCAGHPPSRTAALSRNQKMRELSTALKPSNERLEFHERRRRKKTRNGCYAMVIRDKG